MENRNKYVWLSGLYCAIIRANLLTFHFIPGKVGANNRVVWLNMVWLSGLCCTCICANPSLLFNLWLGRAQMNKRALLYLLCRAVPGVRVHWAVDDDAGGRGQLLLQHAPLRVPLAARRDARCPQGPRHVPPLHRRMPGKYQASARWHANGKNVLLTSILTVTPSCLGSTSGPPVAGTPQTYGNRHHNIFMNLCNLVL